MAARSLHALWPAIARRMVAGLGTRPGELVLIRDGAGDAAILREVMLAVEEVGATPLAEPTDAPYVRSTTCGEPPRASIAA